MTSHEATIEPLGATTVENPTETTRTKLKENDGTDSSCREPNISYYVSPYFGLQQRSQERTL
uniref:Uncharacterized protein n=1 Tax=Hyaloperonospora arabidopsidis (strain Emoy2) TaxID=559515 RepID=M4B864_HYAAE